MERRRTWSLGLTSNVVVQLGFSRPVGEAGLFFERESMDGECIFCGESGNWCRCDEPNSEDDIDVHLGKGKPMKLTLKEAIAEMERAHCTTRRNGFEPHPEELVVLAAARAFACETCGGSSYYFDDDFDTVSIHEGKK